MRRRARPVKACLTAPARTRRIGADGPGLKSFPGSARRAAPGQRNHGHAGWLVQRDVGQRPTLGGELLEQGADSPQIRGSTIPNAVGCLKFADTFNLLFSLGRSVAGERHAVWYLGPCWTGGPEKAPGKRERGQWFFWG